MDTYTKPIHLPLAHTGNMDTHTHTYTHTENLGGAIHKALWVAVDSGGRFTTPAVMKLNQSQPEYDALLLPHSLNIQNSCTRVR